jgi:hypothetical protein
MKLNESLGCKYIFGSGEHNEIRCGNPVVQDGYCGLCIRRMKWAPKVFSDTSMFNIMTICNYVSLCNFFEKKQGRATLINSHQVNAWGAKLRGINYKDMHHISGGKELTQEKYIPIPDDFKIGFYDTRGIIDKLFEVTKGKMSLCGGAVLAQMIRNGDVPNDYDFFFHCDSVEEADDLLKLCMKTIADYLTENFDDYFSNIEDLEWPEWNGTTRYSRSQGAQTVSIHPQDFDRAIKLQFIRRNYQHKDQILLGFDLPCCQYGFNTHDGFFTTIAGGMAYALGMFPLDLTQRSLSFGFRLRKYLEKGFVVLLPGLDHLDGQELVTPDGSLWRNSDKHLTFVSKSRPQYWMPEVDGKEPRASDYDGNPNVNWFYIACDKIHNVTFYADTWQELYDIPETQIREQLFKRTKYPMMDIKTLYLFTPMIKFLGDSISEFIETRDYNQVLAQEIWDSRITYFQDRAVEIYKFINQPENAWRHKNPCGQDFGKFNPLITNPRDWYGPSYKPVTVGITSDRIQAFRSYLGNMFPEDILNLLCYWWLIAEVQDAKDYLFHII